MKRAYLVHNRSDGKLLGRVLANSDEDAVSKASEFWEKYNPTCTRIAHIEVEPNGNTPEIDAKVPVQPRSPRAAKKSAKKEKTVIIL